jgi:hypothetical protein
MNASTTTIRVRIQPHGSSAMLRANGLASASLAGLERQRSCQDEAELDWLLKQHGVAPRVSASRVAILRQTIAAALAHVGERLAGTPGSGVVPETTPAAGTPEMAR